MVKRRLFTAGPVRPVFAPALQGGNSGGPAKYAVSFPDTSELLSNLRGSQGAPAPFPTHRSGVSFGEAQGYGI